MRHRATTLILPYKLFISTNIFDMSNKQFIKEVRQLQKIAGILKEEHSNDESNVVDSSKEKDGLDLKSRLEIAQKAKNEIDSYLNGLGCKKIADEEWPKFEKGHGYRNTTPTNAYGDVLKTWPNHWNSSSDEENIDDLNHEGRIVRYNLRIFKPNENFDYKKISSIISSAQNDAKSKGAAAFKKLSRSNQDILVNLEISNYRKKGA